MNGMEPPVQDTVPILKIVTRILAFNLERVLVYASRPVQGGDRVDGSNHDHIHDRILCIKSDQRIGCSDNCEVVIRNN